MSEAFYQKSSLKHLRKLRNASPAAADALSAMNTFFAKATADGALPAKVKELIAIAVAHATHCPYCIEHHVRAAKKAGASEAEVSEAVIVAMAISAGTAYTTAGMALEAYEEHSAPAE